MGQGAGCALSSPTTSSKKSTRRSTALQTARDAGALAEELGDVLMEKKVVFARIYEEEEKKILPLADALDRHQYEARPPASAVFGGLKIDSAERKVLDQWNRELKKKEKKGRSHFEGISRHPFAAWVPERSRSASASRISASTGLVGRDALAKVRERGISGRRSRHRGRSGEEELGIAFSFSATCPPQTPTKARRRSPAERQKVNSAGKFAKPGELRSEKKAGQAWPGDYLATRWGRCLKIRSRKKTLQPPSPLLTPCQAIPRAGFSAGPGWP